MEDRDREIAIRQFTDALYEAVKVFTDRVIDCPERRKTFAVRLGHRLSEFAGDRPRRPAVATVFWKSDRRHGEDAIAFLRRMYGPYIENGMTQADVRKLDEPLYKAFLSRCFYLQIKASEILTAQDGAPKAGEIARGDTGTAERGVDVSSQARASRSAKKDKSGKRSSSKGVKSRTAARKVRLHEAKI